ncbi:MAG: peroxiredoxin/tetratricopeptide (TPR) repeat protein [Limisphaerales bacterium]|jgi:peroxiredoxin/tetratricopeptide (TPR) repeat protein
MPEFSADMNPEVPLMRTICLCLLLGTCDAGIAQNHDSDHGFAPSSERQLFHGSPYRKAERLTETPEVSLPITTSLEAAQFFFNQGMAFLYAGWPQEAERSFHTAHLADRKAAMPRWGVAMSHLLRDPTEAFPWLYGLQEMRSRKTGFSALEHALLQILPLASAIELKLAGNEEKGSANSWRGELVKALRKAITKLPNEPELKALLGIILSDAWHPYLEEVGESRDRILALVADVVAARPAHPAGRFGLQLWANELRRDPYHTRKNYFDPAQLQLSPYYPVHWNLAGRYLAEREEFAAAIHHSELAIVSHHRWAALRQLAPDQLPNYARHRVIQARQFQSLGKAPAAIAIAHELLRMPRHPVWNSPTNSFGSAYQGRRLLMENYRFFGLWEELAGALRDGRIAALEAPLHRAEHAYARAIAAHFLNDFAEFDDAAKRVKTIALQVKNAFGNRSNTNRVDVGKDTAGHQHGGMLGWLLDGGEEYLALTDWDRSLDALRRFHSSPEKAVESEKSPGRIIATCRRVPDLLRARLLWSVGDRKSARQALLNTAALPLAFRVQALEAGKNDPEHFPLQPTDDRTAVIHARQPGALNTMGLSTWEATMAPKLSIPLLDGTRLTNEAMLGRNTILMMIYSSTCGHCVEQLEALQQTRAQIAAAGLDVYVIAGEPAESLSAWLPNQPAFPAKFASDPKDQWFRQLGAYDEFNDMPLHATIHIGPTGRVLWKDVGYSPFTDLEFLIAEIQRTNRQ